MKKKHKLRDKFVSLETKLKRVRLRLNGEAAIVINNITGDNISFLNIKKAADFIGIHRSYLSKSIKQKKFYLEGFLFINLLPARMILLIVRRIKKRFIN